MLGRQRLEAPRRRRSGDKDKEGRETQTAGFWGQPVRVSLSSLFAGLRKSQTVIVSPCVFCSAQDFARNLQQRTTCGRRRGSRTGAFPAVSFPFPSLGPSSALSPSLRLRLQRRWDLCGVAYTFAARCIRWSVPGWERARARKCTSL
jgi:hypothetical protein